MNKAEAISNAGMSTKFREGFEEGFKEGFREGFRKGIREGRELARIEVAHSMLKDELPLETISKYSKLSIEKLEELKREQE